MKRILAFILITAAAIFISGSVVKSGKVFAAIDSGSDYSSEASSDEGDTFRLFDNSTGISAEVNRHFLDENAYRSLREYYNNYSLTRDELFSRFFELKNSYIDALQAFYNPNYMDPDKKNAETAMKIFYNGREVLYGLDNCRVYLYNIARYEGLSRSEQIHLDMVVPHPANHTVITIKFAIPADKLPEAVKGTVEAMLSGIRFEKLPAQTKAPLVLSNAQILEKARMGIYPAASQKDPGHVIVENSTAGFTASLPSTYVPYIQNSLGGVFTYTSYKIDPNRIFSISSEPHQGSGMSDALMRFKVTSHGSATVISNKTLKYGGKDYAYLSYVSSIDGVKQYYHDYYLQSGSRLYKLQLQSTLVEPGENVMAQMAKILEKFSPSASVASEAAVQTTAADTAAASRYQNNEEGYSFLYPKGWSLEDVSSDIAFDRLRLAIPGLSGALDISVQESELKQIVTFTDIVNSVNGKAVTSWPNLAVNYNPPFKGKTSKLLYSDFSISGPVSTIYRLSVFMDENGRNRLCYSVDIMRDRKLYSLFITAAEYRTLSGRFTDSRVNSLVNMVAASFRLETTPESEARRIAGETRNRKLVFLEKYLKQLIDPRLSVTSVDQLQPDGTFYASVGNSGEGGFYKIRLDYPNRQVAVVGSVLRRSILNSGLTALKELYKDKTIVRATQNESNMTITIEARENAESPSVVRTFKVNASTAGGSVQWQTVRLARQEDYMWECENYILSLLGTGTNVYYCESNVFTDMEPYKQKSIEYRMMTFVTSPKINGFLVLSIDPRSSLFKTQGNLIPVDYVVKAIRTKYGIKYLSGRPDAIAFDPETFVLTLRTADRLGNDTLIEKYRISYNRDKGILEYRNLY